MFAIERNSHSSEAEQATSISLQIPFTTLVYPKDQPFRKHSAQPQSTAKKMRYPQDRERGRYEEDFSDPAEYLRIMSQSSDEPRRIDSDDSPVNTDNSGDNNMDPPSTDDENYLTCDSSSSDSNHGDTSQQQSSKASAVSHHGSESASGTASLAKSLSGGRRKMAQDSSAARNVSIYNVCGPVVWRCI